MTVYRYFELSWLPSLFGTMPKKGNLMLVNRLSAEHYQWGGNCDGWNLLNHSELSVIEERAPPGAKELRHTHALARQFFYVLKGMASIEINGTEYTLKAGDGLEVPPKVPHQFKNASDEDVVFLVISSPSTQGDRMNLP